MCGNKVFIISLTVYIMVKCKNKYIEGMFDWTFFHFLPPDKRD